MKLYFCKTIGDGSINDPFRPSIANYTGSYSAVDARIDASAVGWMMVECKDITQESHSLAILNPDIRFFDTEGISIDDPVGYIPDRTKIKSDLAEMGVSIDGLTSQSTLRDVLNSVINQLLDRQDPTTSHKETYHGS